MATQIASLYADIGVKTDGFLKGAADIKGELGKIGGAIGIVTTAVSLMSQAFDLAQEGAALQRLADSGAEVARQYGGNMDLIIEKVKEASHGTVSEMDIIRSANKAMMLGLGADADQLANLMEIAAFRGRAMGLSTTQAFDDIVRGIGRASPMILDNLGIVVSAKETYENYGNQIGKAGNELTKAEKTQALLNAVLESGNELLDEAGGLVEDNASQYERLAARTEDYKNSLKLTMSEAISPSMVAFFDMADAMDAATEATGRTDQRSRIYLGAMQQQLDVLEAEEQNLRDVETARLDGIAAMYEANSALDESILTMEEEAEMLEIITEANENLLSLTESIQSANDNYAESMDELTIKQAGLNDELNEAITKYGENSSQAQALRDKLADVGLTVEETEAKHRNAMNSIVYDLIVAKLKADGFSNAEFNMAIAAGQALGQIDAKTAETAMGLNAITDATLTNGGSMQEFGDTVTEIMGDGVVTAEELANALNDISSGDATAQIQGIQTSLDGINSSYAVGQIQAITNALNNIPNQIVVSVTTSGGGGGSGAGGGGGSGAGGGGGNQYYKSGAPEEMAQIVNIYGPVTMQMESTAVMTR